MVQLYKQLPTQGGEAAEIIMVKNCLDVKNNGIELRIVSSKTKWSTHAQTVATSKLQAQDTPVSTLVSLLAPENEINKTCRNLLLKE